MTIGFENVYPTPDILSIQIWNITAIEVGIEASTAAASQERSLCPFRAPSIAAPCRLLAGDSLAILPA